MVKMRKTKERTTKKNRLGEGVIYKTLNKDIKEINKVFLSLFSVGIILIAIFIGVNLTKKSYALFSDIAKLEIELEIVERKNIDTSGANDPILDDNMVPVYYDETNEKWRKADKSNTIKEYRWYDYDNKMFANSITVTEETRSTYLKAKLGTEIDMEDILTMQVWIPRYKYKVWNYNSDGTATSNPQEIEIVFEEGTTSTGEIECTDTISGTNGAKSESCKINSVECADSTCNNKYYTHPAFTFGEEDLEGFWIGKFEVSAPKDNICYTNPHVVNCNKIGITPLVKPNVNSWQRISIRTLEANIMAMNDSGNIYGLKTNVDTHMIKNMEWGAVAYLSHSKYGTCDNGTCHEMGANNYAFVTGCGAKIGSYNPSTCNSYETEQGMLASTTGNIYGVYDMSGGSYEYVMGNIVSPNSTTMMSGFSTSENSGYTGIIYDSGNYTTYTGTYSYPDTKYYDKYSFGTRSSQIIRSKLGDGIKEVYNTSLYGWYNDYSIVAYSSDPWFVRGGTGAGDGIFQVDYSEGGYNGEEDYVQQYTSHLIMTP